MYLAINVKAINVKESKGAEGSKAYTAFHGLPQAISLLKDLLLHEIFVAAFCDGLKLDA